MAISEGGISGHWVAGYGIHTPAAEQASAEWAAKIDRRQRVDMVNHYLKILFRHKLIALVPFLGMLCAAVRSLAQAAKLSLSDSDTWLIWCLSAALFGTLGAMNTTSLFGPPINIFYIMLGFCGVMPALVSGQALLPTQGLNVGAHSLSSGVQGLVGTRPA